MQIDAPHEAIEFSVSDTGIGIAQADLARLFTPFTQLDSGLNRRHEGTGLGLALVRQIVDLLGGSVHVTSAGVNCGSCFTVRLPWIPRFSPLPQPAATTQENATTGRNANGASRKQATILLVEDNETTIALMREYLRMHYQQVLVARNGEEALSTAFEQHPDLILMDVQLPILDGLSAIEQLRELPDFQKLPIIALTALAMPGDRERCLAAGANEYVTKPVSLRDIRGMIDRYLGGTCS